MDRKAVSPCRLSAVERAADSLAWSSLVARTRHWDVDRWRSDGRGGFSDMRIATGGANGELPVRRGVSMWARVFVLRGRGWLSDARGWLSDARGWFS
jgi:hypothetical protein